MANKMLTFALIFAVNLILIAANDCECPDDPTPTEMQEIWDYLSKQETENEDFTVIAGELSPLIPCNCLESKRMKRKIEGHKEDGEKIDEDKERTREERSPTFFRAWRHASEQRNKCPFGYRRLSIMCIKMA